MTDTSPTPEFPQLGPYRIEALIGEGAYARVYRAVDERLNRTVALKILKPTLLGDPDAVRRFLREAQVAAGLFHQRLATVLDAGEAGGYYYLAMRYVEGPNLAQVLAERGPLPWDEVVRLTQQIAEALSVLHAQGIVHRDLKPQNILLEHGREVVLTDFGLVHALHSSGLSTHSTALVGTPAYIPPESWEGQKATPQADQYALACVVYEMATGKVLYDGPSTPAIMRKHFGEPPLPEVWPEGVPAGLGAVLRKALAREPKKRYPTIAIFVQAVTSVHSVATQGQAISQSHEKNIKKKLQSSEPFSGEREKKRLSVSYQVENEEIEQPAQQVVLPADQPPKRKVSFWWLIVLLISGALVIPLVLKHGPVFPTESITVKNVKRIQMIEKITEGWGFGEVEDISWSPDSQQLAVAFNTGLYLYDIHTSKRKTSWDPNALVYSVAFSPDGNLIALGAGNQVWLVRSADCTPVQVLKGHESNVYSVSFSPDGSLVASGAWDNSVRLWRSLDGTLIRTLSPHVEWEPSPNAINSLAFSPDGRLLVTGESYGAVRLWNVPDGTLLRTLSDNLSDVRSVAFSPNGNILAAGTKEGRIYLWKVNDGGTLQTLEAQTALGIEDLSFSSDGSLLASTSDGDGATVQLWRILDGTRVRTLVNSDGYSASSVAFSPNGRLLAVGDLDGTISIWGIKP